MVPDLRHCCNKSSGGQEPQQHRHCGQAQYNHRDCTSSFLSHIYEFGTQFLYYSFLLLATRQDHATSSTNTRTRPQAIESTHDTMADKLGSLKPQKKIELYSGNYFAACTIGGIIGSYPTPRAYRRHPLTPHSQLVDLLTPPSLPSTWSNAAAKLIPASTSQTSQHGAASWPKRVSAASSLVG